MRNKVTFLASFVWSRVVAAWQLPVESVLKSGDVQTAIGLWY